MSAQYETSMIDYLFLELSQFTKVRTARELDMEQRKDAAYEERNRCVAALARMALKAGYVVGIGLTDIPGWSADWHHCVYIDLPEGQVSWHYHDSHAHLFDGLPIYAGAWDGHDTLEKYQRLAAHASEVLK